RESESTTVIGPPEARTCRLVATRPSFPATNPLPRPVAVLMSTTDALARAEICAGVRDPPAAGSAPALRDTAASTAATRYKDWRLRVVIRSTQAYPSCPVRVEDRRCVTLGRRAAVPWDTSADALRVRGPRQADREGGALVHPALHGDRAAVRFDDRTGQVQPEAEPAIVGARHRALEPIEYLHDAVGGDADAVVFHLQLRGLAGVTDDHLDGPTRSELDGVCE